MTKTMRSDRARHGYGRKWNVKSQKWLMTHRLCAHRDRNPDICVGVATDVDHINGWTTQREFWDSRNWQALCKPCHGRKTGFELAKGPVRHDENGMPTDPDHHWNTEEDDDEDTED